MTRAKSEGTAQIAQFTETERNFVYGVAMKYMRDEQRASDVTQDALLLAYRHRDSFRGDSRFTTWLYRIAVTTALMHLRKDRSRPECEPLTDEDSPALVSPTPEASPEDCSANHEAVHLAEVGLDEMGVKYGRIFTMRFVEGYSEGEIARRLKLNLATVKTRAHRARTHVRKRLTRALAA